MFDYCDCMFYGARMLAGITIFTYLVIRMCLKVCGAITVHLYDFLCARPKKGMRSIRFCIVIRLVMAFV